MGRGKKWALSLQSFLHQYGAVGCQLLVGLTLAIKTAAKWPVFLFPKSFTWKIGLFSTLLPFPVQEMISCENNFLVLGGQVGASSSLFFFFFLPIAKPCLTFRPTSLKSDSSVECELDSYIVPYVTNPWTRSQDFANPESFTVYWYPFFSLSLHLNHPKNIGPQDQRTIWLTSHNKIDKTNNEIFCFFSV